MLPLMRAMRGLSRVLLAMLCAAGLLAGCKTVPRAPVPPVSLEQLEAWQVRGRLAVSGPSGGGSGTFNWTQRPDGSTVQIRGPVGIGSVRLELRGAPDRPEIELQTGDGEVLEADAAWSELESRLGAALPAGYLRYWLLGLAAPGEHRWSESGSDGEVSLEQQGWRIDYQRYSDELGARLPMRLRATSGAARVRIVIDRWKLGR
jgi:outer membrane lipoprotein LolB